MHDSSPFQFGFDHHPVDWCFPDEETWITGWVEAGAREASADVRLWIDGRIFLGLLGLPFEPPAVAVSGRRRFAFRVRAGLENRRLRFDRWCVQKGWQEFFRTEISGMTQLNPRVHASDWLDRLPRFIRTPQLSEADEVLRSALAQPLNAQPVPPFFGALETPTIDGYLRDGKLLVSGWLAHESQSVRKITARISGGPESVLCYGLQRRDVAEQFPTLLRGGHCHFVGLVDRVAGTVQPMLVLIFAETEDGAVTFVMAQRFVAWERWPAGISSTVLIRGQNVFWVGGKIACAAWRHGIARWDGEILLGVVLAALTASRAAQIAAAGAFAESTPLSLYLSSFEDHEIHQPPVQSRSRPLNAKGLNLLFVLHGDFSCASALHVLALAHELVALGHTCISAVPERLDTLTEHENPACSGMLHADAMQGVIFPNGRGPDIIHAWTMRECVRLVTERVKQRHTDARVIVHLEDNERQVLAAALQRPYDELAGLPEVVLDRLIRPDLAHPYKAASFLQAAKGITVVVDTLASFVPHGIPICLVTPAADKRYFFPQPQLRDFRALLDPTGEATILFYHGNVHPANTAEMRELYAAVLQLNRMGSPTRLIRTGRPVQVDFLGGLVAEVAPFVSDFGHIRRHRHVVPLMALADMFVQPGADNEFNAYRFPSKLPEFFSLGRPVILPRTNLGRRVRHLIDGYVLERADCVHIVAAVQALRADRVLYEQLSTGALAFSAKEFSWERTAGALAEFYASVLNLTAGLAR